MGTTKINGAGVTWITAGSIQVHGSASAPNSWLICDGKSYAIVSYPGLYTAIGNVFGGTPPNFNVPDLRAASPIGGNYAGLPNGLRPPDVYGSYTARNRGDKGGAEAHQLTTAQLASHNHSHTLGTNDESSHTHATGTLSAANESSHAHYNNFTSGGENSPYHIHGVSGSTDGNGNHAHNVIAYLPGGGTSSILRGAFDGVSGIWTYGTDASGDHGHAFAAASGAPNRSHDHAMAGWSGVGQAHSHSISGSIGVGTAHSHTVSGGISNNGSDNAHPNMHPFLAVNFIIKT